uniref:Putative secreted protein n=1 Tax=Anopheles darlingi TaxID=43151 RepID=A0A2M4DHT4_ANODA
MCRGYVYACIPLKLFAFLSPSCLSLLHFRLFASAPRPRSSKSVSASDCVLPLYSIFEPLLPYGTPPHTITT